MRTYILSVLLILTGITLTACGSGGSSPIYVAPTEPQQPQDPDTPPQEPETPTYEALDILQPKNLCIFYGQPDMINGTSPVYLRDETGTIYDIQVTDAVNELANCGLVVFGDGLQSPTHPAYYNAQLIMYGLAEKSIPLFGYVDAGVITQNLSLSEAETRITQWQTMGVNGIFLDDFGFDFGTSRSRQSAFLDLVHSKGLQAFINAYNPDDVFGDKNENGLSASPKVAADDLYLAENWLYADDQYTSLAEWQEKATKLENYLKQYQVRLAATATRAAMQATAYDNQTDAWKYAYWGSVMQRAEYFQWTDEDFGATNSTLIIYPSPTNFPIGQQFTSDIAYQANDATGFPAYSRTTSFGSITIYGDSATRSGVRLAVQ